MFTGIIESLGTIVGLDPDDQNINLRVQSDLATHLRIDQSISHNGVCLTVVGISGDIHTVTAIHETLLRSAISKLETGDLVNLERAMQFGARLDGHLVQGHVDTTAVVTEIRDDGGSWRFRFHYRPDGLNVLVPKGSIAIDGVSLTLVEAEETHFSVAVIPYTYQHTRFKSYNPGDLVNIEFDLIGKYVQRLVQGYRQDTEAGAKAG